MDDTASPPQVETMAERHLLKDLAPKSKDDEEIL